ncbi:MAG: DNA translocase FtsK 4TM domain-containing protein, partial [Flavobacteriales bacterium]
MATKNSLRETPEEEETAPAPKRTRSNKKSEAKGESKMARFKAFVADERTHKAFGLFLIVTSGLLLTAFTSYLFTWKTDQDLMARPWSEFFSKDVHVENWLGKLGALLAHKFMHGWFGIASFAFVLWSFLGGVRILLGTWLLPKGKTIRWSLMALLWLPALLGFIFRGEWGFMGGGIGATINAHMQSMMGQVGAGAVLFLAAGAFTMYMFNPSFDWVMRLFEKKTVAVEPEMDRVAEPRDDEQQPVKKNSLKMEVVENEVPVPVVAAVPVEADATELEVEASEEETGEEDELELEVEDVEAEDLAIDPILPPMPIVVDGMAVVANAEEKTLSEAEIENKLQQFGEYDPKLDLSDYELPPLDLLVDHGSGELTVSKEELEANKDRIVETLSHYNIAIAKIKATIGPTVTLYEIVPEAGVRISKIKNLEDDIALSLAALGIRIIAPIPGKGTIGIEVPNSKPQMVGMRGLLASEKFQNSTMDLPLVLGKTITNETFITDLTKMPHLLMAGATGQGKSVGLNAILVSLLYKKHPSQIKFVLVDPKKVELTLFNKIERHFLAKLPGDSDAIITDTKKVVATLNSLCIEMDDRYELLKNAQVRNIKEYNAKFISRRLNPEN